MNLVNGTILIAWFVWWSLELNPGPLVHRAHGPLLGYCGGSLSLNMPAEHLSLALLDPCSWCHRVKSWLLNGWWSVLDTSHHIVCCPWPGVHVPSGPQSPVKTLDWKVSAIVPHTVQSKHSLHYNTWLQLLWPVKQYILLYKA